MHHLRVSGIAFALGLLMSAPEPALAQDDRSPLRLDGLFPVGARTSLTETWGTLRFGVDNWGPTAREARVVAFYPDRPDVQYTRDVWVPGNSRLSSWLTIGPPPAQNFQLRRDIGYRLYERVDGEFRPVASRDPERLVTRAVPYRPREPSTAVYLDAPEDPDSPESVSTKGSAAAQAVLFARTFRHARGLSEAVSVVLDRQLPPTIEAFDGIDQFVLAGNRLTADPAAARTLRHWVLQGGTLWVLLDRVDPAVLAPVLGEALRFEVVGRTGVTDLRLRPPAERLDQTDRREFEQPVDLVRVQLSGSETVLYEANGWPAAFSQPVGRGRVAFATLDGRGLFGPLLALATAGVFVAAGVASRRAVPPTAASVALVEVTPESGESSWRGMFAVYSPESGGLQVGTDRGGSVELDSTGLDGQTRQRVQTDFDAWHWENLAFPAGVRAGPFRSTNRTGAGATGRFGPNGLDGKLALGTLKNPADAVLFTRAGAALTVRLEPDGAFRATSNDVLPADQYLSGSVLTDRQQRRQDVYRKLLARQNSAPLHDRLYVWADADDVPFTVDGAKRTVGSALLSLPIEFAPRRGGELVTIPHGFVTHAAMIDGRPRRPMLEHSESAQVQLRFQLPPSALPLALERVVLIARVHAPARKFSVAAPGDGKPVPLFDATDSNGPVRIEITDPRALRLDPAGGLLLDLAVSERLGPDGRPNPIRTTDIEQARWHIEGLGLEIVGRAGNP